MKRRKLIHDGWFRNRPGCHAGPVEVVKNLYCGGEDEAFAMAAAPIAVDTLIPLNDLDARIWKTGFRGEILYYPIGDYGVLPDDVLNELVAKILDRINGGKKVGIFCMGGHGRTGYVASAVLGKLGHEDPIYFLRSHYCKSAVESDTQIRHIADVLKIPELAEKYCDSDPLREAYIAFPSAYHDFREIPINSTCGECLGRIHGICQEFRTFVDEDEQACRCFAKE